MQIELRVPATTSNLGPGFDAIGMALELCSTFTCTTDGQPLPAIGTQQQLQVDIEGFSAEMLPRDGAHLVLKTAADALAKHGRALPSLTLRQHNLIPLGSGLGSSSTAIVGGLAIAQALLGMPLDRDALLVDACAL